MSPTPTIYQLYQPIPNVDPTHECYLGYNKIRALKRSSPIVLRKEFFINRSDELALSTVLDVTDVNNNKCKIFANCRNLTDGRTDIKCLSNRRKILITLKDQTKKNVSKFSRNMFTEIRCEICVNHFVEIIFTFSCAVVDINLLQINSSQNILLKMCKKIVHPSIGRYK